LYCHTVVTSEVVTLRDYTDQNTKFKHTHTRTHTLILLLSNNVQWQCIVQNYASSEQTC